MDKRNTNVFTAEITVHAEINADLLYFQVLFFYDIVD